MLFLQRSRRCSIRSSLSCPELAFSRWRQTDRPGGNDRIERSQVGEVRLLSHGTGQRPSVRTRIQVKIWYNEVCSMNGVMKVGPQT